MPPDLLEFTLDPHPLIDLFRYLVGLLGIFCFCVSLAQWLAHRVFWLGFAFMASGLLTALQQWEALGEPFRPWRLPLLVIVNVCAIVHLYRVRSDSDVQR